MVRLWELSPRTVVRVSSRCADQRSRLYGLALGGENIAWASRKADGRQAVWFAAGYGYTGRNAAPRVIDRAAKPAAEFVIADAAYGPGIAYAAGRSVTYTTGGGRFRSSLASPVIRLATDGPSVVAQQQDGQLSVLASRTPTVTIDYRPGEVDAFKVQGGGIVVLHGRRLDYYGRSGNPIGTFLLPAAASYGDDHCGRVTCKDAALRLADLDGGLVVYIAQSAIHVLRLSDGRDTVVRSGLTPPVHAELQATGLSYTSGGKVNFVPRPEILDR